MAGNPPPPILLQPLDPGRAPALQAVYQGSADYFELNTGVAPARRQAEQDLRDAAAGEGRYLLGILLDGEMVGVIDLKLAEPEPFEVRLGLILLAEQHRRQGLGSWALRILEEWLRQATPTEAVVLTVLAQDHAAQAFFRHHGYDFTGRATRVVAGDRRWRLLFMRKKL